MLNFYVNTVMSTFETTEPCVFIIFNYFPRYWDAPCGSAQNIVFARILACIIEQVNIIYSLVQFVQPNGSGF